MASEPRNTLRKCSPTARAWSRKPDDHAGWPQHVWPEGNRTTCPSRARTAATFIPTCGKNWSTWHGMKSETFRATPPLDARLLRGTGVERVIRVIVVIVNTRAVTHARSRPHCD